MRINIIYPVLHFLPCVVNLLIKIKKRYEFTTNTSLTLFLLEEPPTNPNQQQPQTPTKVSDPLHSKLKRPKKFYNS